MLYTVVNFDIDSVLREVEDKLLFINQMSDLEDLKSKYLGPRGIVRGFMSQMRQLTVEEKREFGPKINQLKNRVDDLFSTKYKNLKSQLFINKIGTAQEVSIDENCLCGTIHPLTLMCNQLVDIFHGIGFTVAQGPEIETEWFCFDALNTPETHPARNEMDTFYLGDEIAISNVSKHDSEKYLLRSHTSTVQIRTMLKEIPPIRIVAPGRTFRRDTVDATHSANFHQFEGLCVDKNISFCDLQNVLNYFLQKLFGTDIEIRWRPSFFPFTEPSFEVDFRSKNIGNLSNKWIEVLGCGMVDPAVLNAVNIDSEQYSGFAFGVGLERIAMLKYEIDDVRSFYQNDLRFLTQFT